MKDFFHNPIQFFIVAVVITVLLFFSSSLVPQYGSDAEWYIAIANGHLDQVISPFSSRFLQPFLAGTINFYSGIGISQSFLFLALSSLILFLFINSSLLKKTLQSPFLLIPIFLLPYLAMILQAFFLPDIFYIFLSALFFLLLFHEKEWACLLILFLLFLTRESTIILGVAFLITSLLRSKKLLSLVIFLVMIISIFTTQQIADRGLPNRHNLGGFSYIVLKMPYNFLNNILGIKLWVNTSPNNCAPVFTSNLPGNLSIGSVNKVGFCSFDSSSPFRTVVILLTVFGVLPLVLFYLLFSKFKPIMSKFPPWLITALIYGLVYYFMSIPATGAIQKFAGYGWPAFLLATPFLVKAFFQIDIKFITKLSLVQVFVAWLPIIISDMEIAGINSLWFITPVILVAYLYVFVILKNQKMRDIEDIKLLTPVI